MVELIKLNITGIDRTNKFLINMSNNVVKEVNDEMLDFMKAVQKSAKLRAPRWTGALARSITVGKTKGNMILLSVDSPYGVFQELGFRPHIIYAGMDTRTGRKVGEWMNKKGIKGKFVKVSKFKPFVEPAIKTNLPKMPRRFEVALKRAVRRSK